MDENSKAKMLEVVDPVCGEMFPSDLATFKSAHGDRELFFCSSTCKEAFDEEPAIHPLADDVQGMTSHL